MCAATSPGPAGDRPPVKPRKRRAAPPPRPVAQARPPRRWRERITAVPPSLITLTVLVVLAAGIALANTLYQVVRKPAELLYPLRDAFTKTPAATWKTYAADFRKYSTAAITPELLAALAQSESAGNPAAHTYWRWNLEASDLFEVYRPASSSVGMYQMTDPAYADAQRYCIRQHVVTTDSCDRDGGTSRLLPDQAIDLAAIYLDRGVAAVLGPQRGRLATPLQKREVAALTHLCGAGPARAFVRRGFRLEPGERCGDHDPAEYLARIDSLARHFARLAAAGE